SGNNKKLISVNSNIEAINELYKQIGSENHVALADINAGLGQNFSLYQDTYHPNEKGYAIIAEILFKTIKQLLKKPQPLTDMK
ncbi:MAG: SGNH/GDSL hydrolase family protein, partial [Janthinobacterium lividum]